MKHCKRDTNDAVEGSHRKYSLRREHGGRRGFLTTAGGLEGTDTGQDVQREGE